VTEGNENGSSCIDRSRKEHTADLHDAVCIRYARAPARGLVENTGYCRVSAGRNPAGAGDDGPGIHQGRLAAQRNRPHFRGLLPALRRRRIIALQGVEGNMDQR